MTTEELKKLEGWQQALMLLAEKVEKHLGQIADHLDKLHQGL